MNELLRQLSSEYSILFFGTSLRDRDLLAILDEVSGIVFSFFCWSDSPTIFSQMM